jgi:ankyrin repeat protein
MLDHDNAAAFETLINLGADIEARDRDGLSVIHQVAQRDHIKIIDLVLQRRWADLENRTVDGLRAMDFAAIGNNTLVLQRLLEAGAEIDAQDNDGLTPLSYAILCDSTDAASLLAYRGAYGSYVRMILD